MEWEQEYGTGIGIRNKNMEWNGIRIWNME